MSAEPTIALVIRDRPQKLEAIKARAKRCGMSAGDFYRYVADLAMQLTDEDLVPVAAERMAREQESRRPSRKAPKSANTEPNRPGRPSAYSEALAEQICTLIAEGQSLRSICLRVEMPDQRTVSLARKGWRISPAVRAREAQVEY